MTRFRRVVLLTMLAGALQPIVRSLHAQRAVQAGQIRSKSAGFFLGGGIDGDALTNPSNNATESGAGSSVILGYGFSPRWSLFGDFSGAVMNAHADLGAYTMGYFDIGTRIHFRTGPNVVVPFLQLAFSGRAISDEIDGTTVTGSGSGVTVGGGLNAHFTPAVAFSTALTWTVGDFDRFQVGNVSFTGRSVSARSTRLHLGIIWFPQ